jgi:hypothetical protein
MSVVAGDRTRHPESVTEDAMRRYVIVGGVALAVGLLMAILSIVVLLSPGRTPETWQTALYTYLGYASAVEGGRFQVIESEQAGSPELFVAEMSIATYGEGTYYGVEADYVAETPTPGVFGLSPRLSRRPIPYPPREVWCVWLADDEDVRLVFVNRHQDLYNAAWIVHIGAALPLSPELEAQVTKLGCTTAPGLP